MLKRLFHFQLAENHSDEMIETVFTPAEPVEITPAERMRDTPPPAAAPEASNGFATFTEIYHTAAVKPVDSGYNILKFAAMVNSPHLSGMSQEARRCSLMMALEAAGAHVEDLLQDALIRQRALNEYEEKQQEKLDAFEAAKNGENTLIQAELDRITADYLRRIQANLEEIARQQDKFRGWQRRKQQESQQIAEAAAYCAPQGSQGSNLSTVLARCGADAVMGKK